MRLNPIRQVQVLELVELNAGWAALVAVLAVRPGPLEPRPTLLAAMAAGAGTWLAAVVLLERRLPWRQRRPERRIERSLKAELAAAAIAAAALLLIEYWLQPFVETWPMSPDAWLNNELISFGSIWLMTMAMWLIPPGPARQSGPSARRFGDAPPEGPRFVWPGGRGSS